MKQTLSLIALVAASPVFAQETRQMDAHEHGVGTLDIAIEGNVVEMAFHAPGADIVGFEYEAESDADLAAIDAATRTLSAPLDLFVFPQEAGCSVTAASAELESEDDHDDHDDEDHDDHDDEGHDDHGSDDHDEHDDHDDDAHDEAGHDDHEGGAGHTEFHAEYALECEAPDALTEIAFPYFDVFPNAQEVEVQIVTSMGAQAYEVDRDAPMLDLDQ